MNLIDERIQAYAEAHTSPEQQALQELNIFTHDKIEMPQMLSGHMQGRFLSMVSRMVRPKQVLEIGTYTGYSAICFAEGLAEGGMVHTIDINEDLKELATSYFRKAGVENNIRMYVGNAMEIIPQINEEFDLVFIDADKSNYINYYEMVLPKVRTGGFIIADNILWSGRVIDEEKDNRTKVLDNYNKIILADERVENVLLPIRDGLMIAQKIG